MPETKRKMDQSAIARVRKPRPTLNPERFKMSEITAAVAHLHNMQDKDFQLDTVPRVDLAAMLGVARSTVFRCIKDARESYDLALEIKRRVKDKRKEAEKERAKFLAEAEQRHADAKLRYAETRRRKRQEQRQQQGKPLPAKRKRARRKSLVSNHELLSQTPQ